MALEEIPIAFSEFAKNFDIPGIARVTPSLIYCEEYHVSRNEEAVKHVRPLFFLIYVFLLY